MEIKLIGTKTDRDGTEVEVALSIADISENNENWLVTVTEGSDEVVQFVVTDLRETLDFIHKDITK